MHSCTHETCHATHEQCKDHDDAPCALVVDPNVLDHANDGARTLDPAPTQSRSLTSEQPPCRVSSLQLTPKPIRRFATDLTRELQTPCRWKWRFCCCCCCCCCCWQQLPRLGHSQRDSSRPHQQPAQQYWQRLRPQLPQLPPKSAAPTRSSLLLLSAASTSCSLLLHPPALADLPRQRHQWQPPGAAGALSAAAVVLLFSLLG